MCKSTAIYWKILSKIWAIALFVGLGSSSWAYAQQDADIRFSLEPNSRLSGYVYVPGQWGDFHLRLDNREDTPKELLCTSFFDSRSTLQYGRKFWLPARSSLVLSHPVLIPTAEQLSGDRLDVHSLVVDDSQGKEVLIKSGDGRLQHDRSILVKPPDDRLTGIVAGWKLSDTVPPDVLELVVADRVYQGLNNTATFLAGQFLPADETRLAYLDHLVLAEDRLVNDLAALTAVRRWVHSGGRLWIMLDRTGPALLERLFGDEFQGFMVDRVGLSSVQIDTPPSVVLPEGAIGETVEYEEPVEFARLNAPDMTVLKTVGGWPAALTKSYGEGSVVVTTLGARAWLKPAPPFQPTKNMPTQPQDMITKFVPRAPMEDVAPYIFARRAAEPLPPEALEPFAQEFISYDVPAGALVIGSMAGFLVLLAATGGLLWRWGRLEHFGWCGSLLALIFSVLLFGIGVSHRQGAAETIASIQLAQAISGTDDVQTHGAIAVYRPEGGQTPVQASQGGTVIPDDTGSEGSTTRMVTTDLGTFHWEGLSQPAGMAMYRAATSGTNANRLEARATVDAQGVVGTCGDQLSAGTDATIVTRRGKMGVTLKSDGTFTAAADNVLDADQFLDATLLTDVQDRRRRILQQLFSDRQWQKTLDQPHVLVWVDDWQQGIDFGEGLQRQGDTLLVAPLKLTRPQAGTEVVIASPLLDYVSGRPPDGQPAAGFWDDGRQEWQERSKPSTTWLSFQIPKAFLPFDASRARLEISVSGLLGKIEVLAVKDGQVVTLQTESDPVGTVEINIDDPDALAISESGELSLGISAGIEPDPAQDNAAADANSWRFHSLSLQLWGNTTDSTVEE